MLCLKRLIPYNNCVKHRIISKDIVVYGHRVYVRWSSGDFGDCNDILFLSEDLEYSVLLASSEKLPVIIAILYSKPDIVKDIKALVVRDVKDYIKCVFDYSDILAKDVVAMDFIPKVKELIEKQMPEIGIGPKYVANTEEIYSQFLESCSKICCKECKGYVEKVTIGPEIEYIRRVQRKEYLNLVYSIAHNFMYMSDGDNHVFIDVRGIDPFEIGEDYIAVVYGVYNSKEVAYALYLGEETIEKEHFEKLVDNLLNYIIREDGKLRSPMIIANYFSKLVTDSNE